MEVRRGKKIDKGDVTIGHELFLKVVKNKLAPPFRTGHTSLIYGQGIPMGVAVVDMAVDYGVIHKKGSWLAYKGETLEQGKDAVAKFLDEPGDAHQRVKAHHHEHVPHIGANHRIVNPQGDGDLERKHRGGQAQVK